MENPNLKYNYPEDSRYEYIFHLMRKKIEELLKHAFFRDITDTNFLDDIESAFKKSGKSDVSDIVKEAFKKIEDMGETHKIKVEFTNMMRDEYKKIFIYDLTDNLHSFTRDGFIPEPNHIEKIFEDRIESFCKYNSAFYGLYVISKDFLNIDLEDDAKKYIKDNQNFFLGSALKTIYKLFLCEYEGEERKKIDGFYPSQRDFTAALKILNEYKSMGYGIQNDEEIKEFTRTAIKHGWDKEKDCYEEICRKYNQTPNYNDKSDGWSSYLPSSFRYMRNIAEILDLKEFDDGEKYPLLVYS